MLVEVFGHDTTSEVHYLDSSKPEDAFTVLQSRIQELEYSVEHYDGKFLILNNDNGAKNFKLASVSTKTPARENWKEMIAHRDHVKLLGATPGWLRYQLPRRYQRVNCKPLCIGQKQVWFLLKLRDDDVEFNFHQTREPEFRDFRWVNFWYPADHVVRFKRRVYRQALTLLEPMAAL